MDYGDPNLWSELFEESVLYSMSQIETYPRIRPKEITEYFEAKAGEIAEKRQNPEYRSFGIRRDVMQQSGEIFSKLDRTRERIHCTPLHKNNYHGYALERALSLPYSDHFINKCGKNGTTFKSRLDNECTRLAEGSFTLDKKPASLVKNSFTYGLVQGMCRGKIIPLTQYIFSIHVQKAEIERYFGSPYNNAYIFYKGEWRSALCLHTSNTLIPRCMEHIHDLIKQALEGDLTVIPNIHWWYVHTAPVYRGSGGIAEMVVNTLCRLHGIDLPAWAKGVAPAVEALLEPDESRYAENFHKLFAENNEELKKKFRK